MLFQSVFPASISSFSCIHFSVFMSLFFCFFCRFFSVFRLDFSVYRFDCSFFRFECSVLPVFISYFPRIFIFVLSAFLFCISLFPPCFFAFYSCTSCILLLFFLHSSFGFPFSPLVLFAFYSCTSCILLLFFCISSLYLPAFFSLFHSTPFFIFPRILLRFIISFSGVRKSVLDGLMENCGSVDVKPPIFFVRMFRGLDVKVPMFWRECSDVSM